MEEQAEPASDLGRCEATLKNSKEKIGGHKVKTWQSEGLHDIYILGMWVLLHAAKTWRVFFCTVYSLSRWYVSVDEYVRDAVCGNIVLVIFNNTNIPC